MSKIAKRWLDVEFSVVGTIFDDGEAFSTGDGALKIPIPDSLDGATLTSVGLLCDGTVTTLTQVQVHNQTAAVDMLSTLVSIDASESSSLDAATPYAINGVNAGVSAHDIIRIDVDAGTGSGELWIMLGFTL